MTCPRCDQFIGDAFEHFIHVPPGKHVDVTCPHCGAELDCFEHCEYVATDKNPPPVEPL